MAYWGKVVGAVAGLATGRPLMALVGLILGHQFDRGFANTFSKIAGNPTDGRLEKLSAEYVAVLFQVIGHLAKADGRVSEDEIRAARSLMHRLGLGPAEARRAIGWFEEGKRADFPVAERLEKLKADGARKPEARALFVRLLMEIGLANATLDHRQRAVLWDVCKVFDIGRVELAQMEAMLRAQRGFRASDAGTADAKRVDAAYKTLGVDRTSSNDDIKKAYRRLMNRIHPDKIAADNPDDAEIAEAERRTREVRGAYEMLKVRRSIR